MTLIIVEGKPLALPLLLLLLLLLLLATRRLCFLCLVCVWRVSSFSI
jgi:hypothetical protein